MLVVVGVLLVLNDQTYWDTPATEAMEYELDVFKQIEPRPEMVWVEISGKPVIATEVVVDGEPQPKPNTVTFAVTFPLTPDGNVTVMNGSEGLACVNVP